jgi:DNA-binding response OmpR family regulator
MRILVVEDDPVLSDGLKVSLGLFGATIDIVATCADGRAAAANNEFDAFVLDVMLPDGSGLGHSCRSCERRGTARPCSF